MASPLPAVCWATKTVSLCMTVEDIDAAFTGLKEMDQRESDTAVMLAERMFLQNLREETGRKEWRKLKALFNVAKTLGWISGQNLEKKISREASQDKEEKQEILEKISGLRHMAAKICEYRQADSHRMIRAAIEEIDASKILRDPEAAHSFSYMKLMVRLEDRFRAAEKNPPQSKNFWGRSGGKKPGL
jgi:hypothetical protein